MVDQFMTVKDAAHSLGLSMSFTRKLCRRGEIAGARKWGSMWYVPLEACENGYSKEPGSFEEPPWEWESAEQVAQRCGLNKCWVTELCQMGRLPALKGEGFRAWRIKKGATPTPPQASI